MKYFSKKERQRTCGYAHGSTLLEVLIAVFVLGTAFVAIGGIAQLSLKLVGHTKARIGGVALADERIEYIRSLPYASVGTVSGIPPGTIPQSETLQFNGIAYTRRTLIQYVDDPQDGSGGADQNGITADYKRAKVELSWSVGGVMRSFSVISNIVPKGIESLAGGGTLMITVINALGLPLSGAQVQIENNTLVPPVLVNITTNAAGVVLFPGSPAGSSYKITATKAGMSTAQTYDADAANPNPNPGHLTVVADTTTSATFQIDTLGSKAVRTFTPVAQEFWEDLFNDTTKIFQSASTTVTSSGGPGSHLQLAGMASFEPEGYAIAHSVAPTLLNAWVSFSWNQSAPAGTSARYRLYYIDGLGNAVPIPDGALPGNASGFTVSPVSLSGLSPVVYPQIQPAVTLSTSDTNVTPRVLDWRVTYMRGPVPLGDVAFTMRGNKTIGTTGTGAPIYKYSQNLQTDGGGTLPAQSIEFDAYTMSVAGGAGGYDIAEACPPQPFQLNPGVSTTTNLYLSADTAHSFVVVVKDAPGAVVSGASARLYGSGGVDSTKQTSACGQAFWSGLPEGTIAGGNPYSLSVLHPQFQTYTNTAVDVSGVSSQQVILVP